MTHTEAAFLLSHAIRLRKHVFVFLPRPSKRESRNISGSRGVGRLLSLCDDGKTALVQASHGGGNHDHQSVRYPLTALKPWKSRNAAQGIPSHPEQHAQAPHGDK